MSWHLKIRKNCRHAVSGESQVVVKGRSEKETELLSALASFCIGLNTQHWSTRRHILSLMADKVSLKEMREFIPTVTTSRATTLPTPQAVIWKSCSFSKPGEKESNDWTRKIRTFCVCHNESTSNSCSPLSKKKLSTGEVIKTPNVIRAIILERIVQQYQQCPVRLSNGRGKLSSNFVCRSSI